ncbi:hypothetical protein ACFFSW_06830 [Saccharothrix longispora]|uniref:Chromosome segregation ATPase n=1 Tax=Saccharothrix longispora TaxID=33920 RepID=A0ABU1PT11_9PSEU|nr:hypothetical protein [Saccharothrix longispora]MDR6593787.1 chromosome segregation ATPase [Saccharothrix longispora]
MIARKPTGRPPRYCPAEDRDCQARARAERITARAAGTVGGPGALRQGVAELAGHLDEVWEPLQDLVESVQASRELLSTVRDELVARAEQAEQAAERATAAQQQAEQRAQAAEASRDEALGQAREARAQRTEALRARDGAEQAKQDALRAQERLHAERDAAREQAEQAATTATATVAAITATADQRVRAAGDAVAEAREQAAGLRAQVDGLREQLEDRDRRLREAEQAAERLRADTTRRVEQVVADADRRVEQAGAETSALREQHERRVIDLGRQLGAQSERADRLQRAYDRHRELLDRVLSAATADTASTEPAGADTAEPAGERHGARNALDAVIALLEPPRVAPDVPGSTSERSP